MSKKLRMGAAAIAVALVICGGVSLFKDDTLQSIQEAKIAGYSPVSILEAAVADDEISPPDEMSADCSRTEALETASDNKIAENTVSTPLSTDICEQLKTQAADLRAKYPEAIGWLYIPDTAINYPVMQSDDNAFYLNHAPDGSALKSGSVFLDFRCEGAFKNNYNILYAHNKKNGSMFADVCKFKSESFFAQHPYGYLTTPDAVYTLEFFSVAVTSWTDTIYNGYSPLSERVPHIREISRIYDEIELDETDRLVSLSTCSYEFENARTVLTARLQEACE